MNFIGTQQNIFDYESARTRVRQALVFNLLKIQKVNRFFNNITKNQVSTEIETDPGEMRVFPYINVMLGEETYRNSDNNYSLCMHEKTIQVDFDCYLFNAKDAAIEREHILSDIENLFSSRPMFGIPDEKGKNTALSLTFVSSTSWGLERQKPNCGITLVTQVKYNNAYGNSKLTA